MHFIKLFQPFGKSFSLFFNISIENETLKDMYIYKVLCPVFFCFSKECGFFFLWFSSVACYSKPFNTTGITNKGTSPYDGICWKVVHSSFIKELRLKSRFTSSYGDFGGIKAIWIINNYYLQL